MSRSMRLAGLLVAGALVAAACSSEEPVTDGAALASPSLEPIQTGIGVTELPCPDAVNAGNGCIYLGVITDLSGPFAALAVGLTEGQQAFWQRVNEQGGIGGAYDVTLSGRIQDAGYDVARHAAAYRELEVDILALAQTLGTGQTLGILDAMQTDEVVGVVATWWSGWEFEPLLLATGSNYCIDAMNGLDWALENGVAAGRVVHVFYPDEYGRDANAGLKVAAATHGIEVTDIEQVPVNQGGDVAGAIAAIVDAGPALVMLTVGPTETGQIVGGTAENGFTGMFLGNHPTFNHALLENPDLAAAMVERYRTVGPHEAWGADTPAHAAMREAFGEGVPDNNGWTFGWMLSYPLRSVLDAAFRARDLTRAGLVAAAASVVVDYEGGLPTKIYGGDPNTTVQRVTTIGVPDPGAPLGLATLVPAYAGTTAAAYQFSAPCSAPTPVS